MKQCLFLEGISLHAPDFPGKFTVWQVLEFLLSTCPFLLPRSSYKIISVPWVIKMIKVPEDSVITKIRRTKIEARVKIILFFK